MKIVKWWMSYVLMAAVGDEGGGGAGGSGGDGGDQGAGGDDKGGGTDATNKADPLGALGAGGKDDDKGGKSGSVDDKVGDNGKKQDDAKGYWPDDWREKAANGDAKVSQRLGRYASPEAVATALIAAQNRISSGELKTVLGKDAKPEEIATWRKENGIPETAAKYDLQLGDGLVVGKDDLPLVNKFLEAAHGTNQTPDQVKASLRAYYAVQESITQQRAEADMQAQDDATDSLRAEWGNEFKRNMNQISGLMDSVGGKGLKDQFLSGRLADGTPIGSSPAALKMLLSLALINNPAGTVVPAGGGNMMQSVEDEISKIEEGMRKNRTAYDKDEKTQARYRELLGAREQLKTRKG